MQNGEQAVLDFLRERSPRNVSVILHEGADPDAICSGFAICHLLDQLYGAKATLMAPGKVSSAAKRSLSDLDISITKPDLDECDLVIVVDTSSLSMLGDAADLLQASKVPVVQIDHHSPSQSMEKVATIRLLDDSSPSTTEIVYSLFKRSGVLISKNLAQVFVFGIVAESGHLLRLRNSSLKKLCELLQRGGDVEAALIRLKKKMPLDERIARLKSAQRLIIKRVDDLMIAISHVGSYHTSAAKGLLTLGADLVATIAKNKEIKIAIRASENYISRTGIHVGKDICIPLGKLLGGEGSGHKAVGGIRVRCSVSHAKSELLQFLEDKTSNSLRIIDR
ncbi:MAG: DHH family phosphoesterase [Thermoproteota archaeon]